MIDNQPDAFEIHLQEWWEGKRQDGALDEFIAGDSRFPAVCEEAVEAALQDFPLPLVVGRDMKWLALVVRRSLASVTPYAEGLPKHYQGNAITKANLVALSNQAKSLLQAIEEMGTSEADTIASALPDAQWLNYQAGLTGLKIISTTIETVAERVFVPTGPWRKQGSVELRIRQAWSLSPIYEAAFGREATVNDRPNAQDLGPWPTFFAKMIQLATGEAFTFSQLRHAVKAGRQRHQSKPICHSRRVLPI